jgi:hypothetical protein
VSHILTARVATLTFAVLFAVIPIISAPVFAQDTETPDWLVPNATYVGVWKTEGANPAPDLDSQITFGYPGADGNLVFIQDDGKIAIRYGVNAVGAPNHSVTNILATRTPDGFKFGAFDPSRNSAEFTFVVSADGVTMTGARHARFNGREYFNNVQMTRVDAASVAPAAQPATGAAFAPFTPPGGNACFMQDRFRPVSQNGQLFRDQFLPPGDGVSPEHAAFVGAWSGRSPDNGEEFRLVVFRVGAPDSRVAFVGSTFQSQGFWTPDTSEPSVMRFESSFGNVNTFRMIEDGNAIELTRGVPGQGSLRATLTRCSFD